MIDQFKQRHLNLEIKCNLKIVDYLDIKFDLITGDCLNHTIKPKILPDMLMQNQVTYYLY